MKIGIITHIHENDNYGGTLQAFALQSLLETWGHQPFFVNCSVHRRPVYWKRLLEHPIREIQRMRRYRRFIPFWKRFIRIDPQGNRSFEELFQNPTPTDIYICGSDQIWADGWPKDPQFRRFAFADFGGNSVRRISYAPGWSTREIESPLSEEMRRLLGRFDALSARERAGVDLMRDLGFESTNVLDPTLLFDQDFWSQFVSPSKKYENILFLPKYRWKTEVKGKPTVRTLVRAKRLKLIVPSSEAPFEFPFSNQMVTPEEWLTAIAQSKFVLTNSFHATVFAILFHRPFAVMKLAQRHEGANARFETLLGQLGLENRLLTVQNDILNIVSAPIDWADVDARLSEMRAFSLNWLRNALETSPENV